MALPESEIINIVHEGEKTKSSAMDIDDDAVVDTTETSPKAKSSKNVFTLPEDAGDRHVGRCIAWNFRTNTGTVIDDEDCEEYLVEPKDIQSVDRPILHVYETVEFCIEEKKEGGPLQATIVTKPGCDKVKSRWRESKRSGQMAPAGETRYLGFIEKFEKPRGHGFIVFKTQNYRNIYFPVVELQTTGEKQICLGAEVEFTVVEISDKKRQARNITRVGGGLITNERGLLGKMLRKSEINFDDRLPLEANSEPMSGIVECWFSVPGQEETGRIWSDNGRKPIRCKSSDIISTGAKILRPQSQVEFVVKEDHTAPGGVAATDVTGPNRRPYIDVASGPVHDHLKKIGKSFEEKENLEINPLAEYTGWVKSITDNGEFGYIESNDPTGKRHVEFTYHQIDWQGPGFPTLEINQKVQFSTCSWDDGTVRAIKITQVGGDPFKLDENSPEYKEIVKPKIKKQPLFGAPEPEPVKIEEPRYIPSKVPLQAPPRKAELDKLIGVIVDYNLPSLKGILQPLAGLPGGEICELLQFDVPALQCESFRAVKKWERVEFSRIVDNTKSKASYITGLNNTLIQFDETKLIEKEKWLLEAHQARTQKQMKERYENNRPQGRGSGWGPGPMFPVPPYHHNQMMSAPYFDGRPPFMGHMGWGPPPYAQYGNRFAPY